MGWKGLILAGGTGSRLFPVTTSTNKHLVPVYDKPMIYYPLCTLMLAGIKDIVLVSDPGSLSQFKTALGDGGQWGIKLEYRAQQTPGGIAQGLSIAADALMGHYVALMLGDNILYGTGLPKLLTKATGETDGAIVFSVEVANPSAYGVVTLDANRQPVAIQEKPAKPTSSNAVIGLYFYSPDVLDVVARLKPSARGELEITDVNRAYLEQRRLAVWPLGRGIAWLDGGTPENLFDAGQYVRIIEERTGLKICCPEEVAYHCDFIDRARLKALADKMPPSNYRSYLDKFIERD
jgi:glucose-1-phosphate thymidylyltransferase